MIYLCCIRFLLRIRVKVRLKGRSDAPLFFALVCLSMRIDVSIDLGVIFLLMVVKFHRKRNNYKDFTFKTVRFLLRIKVKVRLKGRSDVPLFICFLFHCSSFYVGGRCLYRYGLFC
jgi:hypothetical protein